MRLMSPRVVSLIYYSPALQLYHHRYYSCNCCADAAANVVYAFIEYTRGCAVAVSLSPRYPFMPEPTGTIHRLPTPCFGILMSDPPNSKTVKTVFPFDVLFTKHSFTLLQRNVIGRPSFVICVSFQNYCLCLHLLHFTFFVVKERTCAKKTITIETRLF